MKTGAWDKHPMHPFVYQFFKGNSLLDDFHRVCFSLGVKDFHHIHLLWFQVSHLLAIEGEEFAFHHVDVLLFPYRYDTCVFPCDGDTQSLLVRRSLAVGHLHRDDADASWCLGIQRDDGILQCGREKRTVRRDGVLR